MFKIKPPISLFIFLIIFASYAFSQIKIFNNYTLEDGLPQSQVTTIMEDSRGYMWFGTMGGISRWNGDDFVNYYGYNGLPSSIINNFHEMAKGVLLISTQNGIAYMINDSVKHPPILSRYSGMIVIKALFKNKKIYIGTNNLGLIVVRGNFADTINATNGLPDNHINDFCICKDGSLLIATSKGLTVIRGEYHRTYTVKDGLWHNNVVQLLQRKDGSFLVATLEGINLYKFNKFYKLHKKLTPKLINIVTVLESHDSTLYLGSSTNGLFIIKDNRLENLTVANGLISNTVFTLYEDSYNQIYIGQDGGFSIYQPGIMEAYNNKTGMKNHNSWSIIKNDSGEYLFACGNGVEILKNGNFRQVYLPPKYKNSIIYSLLKLYNGKIFAGSDSGLWELKNNRFIRPYPDSKINNSIIYDMKQNSDGTIYFATYGKGLWILKNNSFTHFDKKNGFPSDRLLTVYPSPSGKVYIGSDTDGFIIMENGHSRALTENNGLLNNIVFSLYETPEGQVWLGTDLGLSIYENGEFTNYKKIGSTFLGSVLWIMCDEEGKKYLGTEQGILVINFKNPALPLRRITEKNGLLGREINQGACLVDDDGSFWVATSKGINHYFPQNDLPSNKAPNVFIEHITLYDRGIILPRHGETLELKYNQNYIRFGYSEINLIASSPTKFKYKMTNLDPEWLKTTQHSVQYTNLEPGNYTFSVKAGDVWGNWSKPVEVNLHISEALWKTKTAYVLYLFTFVLIIFYIIRRYINKELEKSLLKQAELKAQAAESEKKVILAESQRKSEELERAREIQMMLLPQKPPEFPFLDIAVEMKTATEVGGDYYDFFPRGTNYLYVVTGDAAGHGIPAGMMVALTKSALKTMGVRPANLILKRLNYVLKDIMPEKLQMALNVAYIGEHEIEFSAAAMPPVIMYNAQKGKVVELTNAGLPLGYMEEATFELVTIQFHKDDILVFYTNGLPNTTNTSNEYLGNSVIKDMVLENHEKSAEEILKTIITLPEWFSRSRQMNDDITVVVVKHT